MRLASEPGLYVSGAAHAALLVATLVIFADNRKFDDAQESFAFEVLTESQVNDITKGEKSAKEVKPQAPPKAEKIAETPALKPAPPLDEAKIDVPVPPPPLKKIPDPGDSPEPAKPDPVIAALPPPRPEPVKVEPPKVTPPPPPLKAEEKEPEPVKPEAEIIEPKPIARPKEESKPKLPEPPTHDALAKLLEQKKLEEQKKIAARPKSGDAETTPQRKTDPLADAAKFLSKEKPQQTASAAKDINRTASLGSPTQNAQRMSPSLSAQLDGWMQDRYLQCWSQPLSVPGGRKYIPVIQVSFRPDGALAARPILTNPPNDPAWRLHADSALRAVDKCDPLQIPAKFLPYYDSWKSRAVHFDREDVLG